jgi:hypothetical protein
MNTRAFQAADIVKTPQLGTITVDIYNTEEEIRSAGYVPTGNSDQYGYMIWVYAALETKPYHHQKYAELIKIS